MRRELFFLLCLGCTRVVYVYKDPAPLQPVATPATAIPNSTPEPAKSSEPTPTITQTPLTDLGPIDTKGLERAFVHFNEIRAIAGVPLVTLDTEMSTGSQAHADYLKRNYGSPAVSGLSAHQEVKTLPGYSEAGHNAGMNSDINWEGNASHAIDAWMATLYHRVPIIDPQVDKIGIGHRDGITVLMFHYLAKSPSKDAVMYPAAYQSEVPLGFNQFGEMPDPRPNDWGRDTGYPITLTMPRELAYTNFTKTSGRLFDEDGNEVTTSFSSGEKPALARFRGQPGVFCLLPEEPLSFGAAYQAEFSAELNGKALRWSWSFTTQAPLSVNNEKLLAAKTHTSAEVWAGVGQEILKIGKYKGLYLRLSEQGNKTVYLGLDESLVKVLEGEGITRDALVGAKIIVRGTMLFGSPKDEIYSLYPKSRSDILTIKPAKKYK